MRRFGKGYRIFLVFILITLFLCIDSGYALSNLRIPLGSSSIEKALRGENSHFDLYGVAIDEEGKRLAIEQYQIAINRLIAWLEGNNISISNVVIYGSFAGFKSNLPRLGVRNINSSILEALLLQTKDTPLDIDICVPINMKREKALVGDLAALCKDILNENGIKVQVLGKETLVLILESHKPEVPISEFAGDSLIKAYQVTLASNLATGSSKNLEKITDDGIRVSSDGIFSARFKLGEAGGPSYGDYTYRNMHITPAYHIAEAVQKYKKGLQDFDPTTDVEVMCGKCYRENDTKLANLSCYTNILHLELKAGDEIDVILRPIGKLPQKVLLFIIREVVKALKDELYAHNGYKTILINYENFEVLISEQKTLNKRMLPSAKIRKEI
ncbi:MAG: hypothetical protein KKD11_02860 [Candidatus Omnitrophica bacterium]|nr:hypothetical protein [Candidatus Omnitrophota bacterium]